MLKKLLQIATFLLVLLVFTQDAEAQCAMCKAVGESSSQADADQLNTAGGINKGIIYIMFIPYALLGFLFWYFFRTKIKGFLVDMGVLANS